MNAMTNLPKPNQQLTVQRQKSIGFLKTKFPSNKVKIYEANLSQVKIREFKTNNDIKPLVDILGKWRFYLGIKDELTKEEILMNVNFVRENFNELNLTDITEAINLSLKGSLEVDVRAFQSFTPVYISTILIAYKKYRSKVIIDVRAVLSKLENKPKPPTDQERIELCRANMINMYQAREDTHFSDYGGVVYNFIKKNKLVVFTKSLVDEAMAYGLTQVNQTLRESTYKDALYNTFANHEYAKKNKTSVQRHSARDYVVRKWLNGLDDFNKFLSKITIDMI